MYKLNRFQNLVLKVIRVKKFDINQALWDRYRDGKKEGYAQGRSEKVNCQACTLYQQATKGVQILIDPRIRQQEAQPMNYYQQHPGVLTRYHKDMERKKITRQLEPKTEILPTAPQPHKLRFHRLYAEPNSPFTGL